MEPIPHNVESVDVTHRVRQNAGPAAVAAALMVYFGFLYLGKPTGTDLFDRAWLVFYHTLRIGGVVMAVIAVWSLLGRRPVLIVDAAVSIVIGGLLVLTGVVMLLDGGAALQVVLNVLFGGMFISSAVRNWRDYVLLAPTLRISQRPMAPADTPSTRPEIPIPPAETEAPMGDGIPSSQKRRDEGAVSTPDGYLATFADEDPPPRT